MQKTWVCISNTCGDTYFVQTHSQTLRQVPCPALLSIPVSNITHCIQVTNKSFWTMLSVKPMLMRGEAGIGMCITRNCRLGGKESGVWGDGKGWRWGGCRWSQRPPPWNLAISRNVWPGGHCLCGMASVSEGPLTVGGGFYFCS